MCRTHLAQERPKSLGAWNLKRSCRAGPATVESMPAATLAREREGPWLSTNPLDARGNAVGSP